MLWYHVRRGLARPRVNQGAPIVRNGSCSSRVITEATVPELTLDDRFILVLDHRATRPCPSSCEQGAPIVRSGSCSSRVITEATGPELTLDDRFTLYLDQRATRPCPSSFVRVLMTGRSRLVSGNDVLRFSCTNVAPGSMRTLRVRCVRIFAACQTMVLGRLCEVWFCSSGVPHVQYRPA